MQSLRLSTGFNIMQRTTTAFGVFPTLAVLFAGHYVYEGWGGRFETVGYGAFCAALVAILATIMLVRVMRREGIPVRSLTIWMRRRPLVLRENISAITFASFLTAYAILQSVAGFLIAVVAAFAGLLWFMGCRQPVRLLGLTAGLTAIAWLVLVVLLEVPLPQAVWVE